MKKLKLIVLCLLLLEVAWGQNNYVNNTTDYIITAILADKNQSAPIVKNYQDNSDVQVIITYNTSSNYTCKYYMEKGVCKMATGIYDVKEFNSLINFLSVKFTQIDNKKGIITFLELSPGEKKNYTWELSKVGSGEYALIVITEKKGVINDTNSL